MKHPTHRGPCPRCQRHDTLVLCGFGQWLCSLCRKRWTTMTTRIPTLSERLDALPFDLRRALMDHLNAADDRVQAETLLERKKARIAAEVAAAKGEDGKPVYTNETTRKAEIDRRMDIEADGLLAGVLEAKRREAEAAIQVEVTRSTLRAREAVARLGGQA